MLEAPGQETQPHTEDYICSFKSNPRLTAVRKHMISEGRDVGSELKSTGDFLPNLRRAISTP